MRRGTTPYLTILTSQDLTPYGYVVFTIRDRRGTQLNVDSNSGALTVTSGSVTVKLTQEQTLSLRGDSVEMQIRAVDGDGNAVASGIMRADLGDVLKEGVIADGSADETAGGPGAAGGV